MTPEGWCRVHLSEVADQRVEKIVPAATDNRPYVALEHLAQGTPFLLGWAKAGSATSAKTAFHTGDVLFGKLRPYLCKAAPAPFDGLCSTDILPLFGRSPLDTRYLVQLAQWRPLQQHAVATSSGTKMPRTSWAQLGAFSFSLPPLTEQRKIAAILSSLDDAIEKTLAVIDQVRVVKRGLMQELLTRGLPTRHKRFKQTEIGEIPGGWRTSRIGDIASCDYGTSESLRDGGQGIPILRMGNLRDGRVSLDDVKYLAEDRVPNELLLSHGDVLFNRTNSAELVGKVAVFDHRARVSFASYLLRLRVSSSVGTGSWLSYLLNTDTLQKRLRATATVGVGQVNINRKSLLTTVVPVPPVEEQSVIVSILDSVWHKLESEQNVAARLAEVKSSMLSVLLTGQLRVVRDPERRCASDSDQATALPSAHRRLQV